jgi:hypothetical protein
MHTQWKLDTHYLIKQNTYLNMKGLLLSTEVMCMNECNEECRKYFRSKTAILFNLRISDTTLGGLLATTASPILRLRREETAYRYWISSRGRPTRCGPPAWTLGVRLITPHLKNKILTKYHKEPRTWKDSLDKRRKLSKIYMRFGSWNVRSLHPAGSLMTVAKEISKRKLDSVGAHEVRCDRSGTEPVGEYTFFYGNENENHELGACFCT